MRVFNLGSINIDHVYGVERFVRPGETLGAESYRRYAGGKGFNQSIAAARAAARVRHIGQIGADGEWLKAMLSRNGVDADAVRVGKDATGHAIIQVAPSGENAILLHAGANSAIEPGDIEPFLADAAPGDVFLTQNETSAVPEALRLARARGLTVAFNPAPMSRAVCGYPLDAVDLFILNETEAEGLTGVSGARNWRRALLEAFPSASFVLTLGARGACYFDADTAIEQPGLSVRAVDTTAAGDTFIGYFLASFGETGEPGPAIEIACRAAALCVTRAGAAESIPCREEVEAYRG